MRIGPFLLASLIIALGMTGPALADTGDIPRVIEGFIAKQFPEAQSHFWVVNNTEWGAEDEVVVDLQTVVVQRHQEDPTEKRFLLLIVGGQLVASQSVPVGATIKCKPEPKKVV